MTNPWVCTDCGARQPESGPCQKCRNADTLDARKEQTRELMYDIDLRIAQKAEGRARMIGVGIGIAVVVVFWAQPWYWSLRKQAFAIPFLADQWFLMAVIGFAVSKFLEKKLAKKRFPYLDSSQQMIA